MRKTTLLFCLITLFTASHAQVIELKFTATYNAANVPLDSVKIHNYSHPGDTMLVWPDTSLFFSWVGIGHIPAATDNGFNISLLSSNPCTDEAVINMAIPVKGPVDIRYCDQSGKLLSSFKKVLSAGNHRIACRPAKHGIGIFSVAYGTEIQSLKLIYQGAENDKCSIHYLGHDPAPIKPKSQQDTQTFTFDPGDYLQIIVFYNGDSLMQYATPMTSNTFSFAFTGPYPCPMFIVYGGMTYHTVEIGPQCWLVENLNIGNRVDGITTMSDDNNIEKYCYNNDTNMCAIYGGLYQWSEAMNYDSAPMAQGICPPGFHIPTDVEWMYLVDSTGGYSAAGGNLKETGFTHWNSPNTGATNSYGFTALGGGQRLDTGPFNGLLYSAKFWTSSAMTPDYAGFRSMSNTQTTVPTSFMPRTFGYSVRCLFNY